MDFTQVLERREEEKETHLLGGVKARHCGAAKAENGQSPGLECRRRRGEGVDEDRSTLGPKGMDSRWRGAVLEGTERRGCPRPLPSAPS